MTICCRKQSSQYYPFGFSVDIFVGESLVITSVNSFRILGLFVSTSEVSIGVYNDGIEVLGDATDVDAESVDKTSLLKHKK